VGLAIGLRIPIVPLPSLGLQAARSDTAVTAIVEAGRGRVYFLVPGGQPAVGGPQDLAPEHPLVGWVSPSTEAALIETGHRFRPEAGLRDFSVAAEELLKTAREVPYSSLKLEYMQSFSASK
jgi:tRNA A37 threonylcarbamoyladenosine modification protein TsaB